VISTFSCSFAAIHSENERDAKFESEFIDRKLIVEIELNSRHDLDPPERNQLMTLTRKDSLVEQELFDENGEMKNQIDESEPLGARSEDLVATKRQVEAGPSGPTEVSEFIDSLKDLQENVLFDTENRVGDLAADSKIIQERVLKGDRSNRKDRSRHHQQDKYLSWQGSIRKRARKRGWKENMNEQKHISSLLHLPKGLYKRHHFSKSGGSKSKRTTIDPIEQTFIEPVTTQLVRSTMPSYVPSEMPSLLPSNAATAPALPTAFPFLDLSEIPSVVPSNLPSSVPSEIPSMIPSAFPSQIPSNFPFPFLDPSEIPSVVPSNLPSFVPSEIPSMIPSAFPSQIPSNFPSLLPSLEPFNSPSQQPSDLPSQVPSDEEPSTI
jgi:hypothetical protein